MRKYQAARLGKVRLGKVRLGWARQGLLVSVMVFLGEAITVRKHHAAWPGAGAAWYGLARPGEAGAVIRTGSSA